VDRSVRRLRRVALARSLSPAVTIQAAVDALGYVQADPIRAPARAQDLILRQRVPGYRAGDLERRYPELDVEEDVVVNYGIVSRRIHGLLHPRPRHARSGIDRLVPGLSEAVATYVHTNGPCHPSQVEQALGAGRVVNDWGGSSQATTRALEALHVRGVLRVARRDDGVKVYEAARTVEPVPAAAAARELVRFVVTHLAPLPLPSLSVTLLRSAAGRLGDALPAAVAEARASWPRAAVDGETYLWPPDTDPAQELADAGPPESRVRFLAPFDPVVWDRRRFQRLWGWDYRFEAYTPAARRRFGYYALPVFWRDHAVGWVNAAVADGRLRLEVGSPTGALPASAAFRRAFAAEAARFAHFKGVALDPTGRTEAGDSLRWPGAG